MKYLTEAGRKLLERHIAKVEQELARIGRECPPGSGVYRQELRYKHGLEYLIDMEYDIEYDKNSTIP